MFSKETIGWALVLVAGLLEVGWPICMKNSAGFTRIPWIAAMMVLMCISFGLLTVAVSPRFGLPIGTAYAVWTGLGAAGAAVVGILLFGESRDFLRLVCLGLVIVGIVGLKFTHKEPAADSTTAMTDEAKPSR